jgi:multicomponent Na+:H+ antiporter subunit F
MSDFLVASSGFVLAMVAFGLIRILRGPSRADRMMAAQLLGTGGIAVLLLLSAGTELPAIVDVALVLGLLAAFASAAFVISSFPSTAGEPDAASAHEHHS